MTLGGSLQIGRSGLLSAQTALEVTGNNLANQTTPGYHRRRVSIMPVQDRQLQQGIFVGRGVELQQISRQINDALESRLRGAITSHSGSQMMRDLLGQIESIEGEFSELGLSTQLNKFFSAWSNLANNPQDGSLRTLVLREAQNVTDFMQRMRGSFMDLRQQVDSATTATIGEVNNILDQIETLNGRIALQDYGAGGAAGLRDQRDMLLGELSKYLDISVSGTEDTSLNIFVGSLPIMLNGQSRGIDLRTQNVDGQTETDVIVSRDGSPLDISTGELGALVSFRENDLADAIDTLDTFANQFIWQVNRLHSQGQGVDLLDGVTGAAKVDDATVALNSALAGLDFTPTHGSFEIHVTQQSTGQRVTHTIQIDLDGINAGSDTTLNSLVADLNGVTNISASITADGRLQITPDSSDFQISFSNDSSGALAALDVNTFFTGGNAMDIDVNQTLADSPMLLAAAQGHLPGDNSNALAIAALRDQSVDGLGGLSLSGYWRRHVEDFASRLSQARQQVDADAVVQENLQAQQQAVSGVNADEEAIDLIRYQRAYQASARFLNVVNELMDTLLSLV